VNPIVKLLLGSLLGPVTAVVEKYIGAKTDRARIQADLEAALMANATQIEAEAAKVILAEAQGESWLQRNWRPVVALTAFFSCWFVVFPYAFFVQWGVLPQVRFGEAGLQYFFSLTSLCVGGYVGGRSLEKIAKTVWGK
jgi:hypothetical protein